MSGYDSHTLWWGGKKACFNSIMMRRQVPYYCWREALNQHDLNIIPPLVTQLLMYMTSTIELNNYPASRITSLYDSFWIVATH